MPLRPQQPAQLLLVDDDPSIIQAISRVLGDLGRCRFARSAEDALRLLRSEAFDLMLLDAEMPGMGGFAMLDHLRLDPALADLPVLFVTSHRDEAIEEAAFAAGAVDFIPKPIRPAILRARVTTQLRLKRAMDAVQQLARTDTLTGLSNRRAFVERLEVEVGRSLRGESDTSLLVIDVDHFKRYNDHYGHPAGDEALRVVAECLRTSALRPADLPARWGGEEFVLLLAGTDARGAEVVAQTVHARMAALALPHPQSTEGRLTLSIGIAVERARQRGESHSVLGGLSELSSLATASSELVQRADNALYTAKSGGRNRTVVADEQPGS